VQIEWGWRRKFLQVPSNWRNMTPPQIDQDVKLRWDAANSPFSNHICLPSRAYIWLCPYFCTGHRLFLSLFNLILFIVICFKVN
jgi:hypothetical protein